jgi:YebC/PmpR family DNA-binding regulatory protein
MRAFEADRTMAGHSHSANVARRKNAVDAKRAKIFSKCARAIISATRQGGPDPDQNLKLKYAVEAAKAQNMPKDNIERAIKSASGDKSGDDFEELVYEGYAPGGVALIVTCLTDNRNRTAPDVKYAFERRGGNMGSPGSVAFMFDKRAMFSVETGDRSEDDLMELALEVGAEDVVVEDDVTTFYSSPTEFLSLEEELQKRGFEFLNAEVGYVPQTTVSIESRDDAAKILKIIGDLEDNEDVQQVYANYDMPAEWLEELGS